MARLHLLAAGTAALAAAAIFSPLLPAWAASSEPPISRIPVVFKTSWPAIVALADSAIPKCTGRPPVCQDQDQANYIFRREDDWFVVATILRRDIGWKGSVWRFEPLELSLTGGKLRSSLNLFYRTKIGFTQGSNFVSCGYDQPASEAVVGGGGKIVLSPDWYVDFTFKPILKADIRCGAVFERVDLAKWSGPIIDKAMETATEKIRDLVRAETKVREHAIPIWAKLQEPIPLAPSVWLDVRPYAAFANVPEVTDDGKYLTMKVGLEARPHVVLGLRPTSGTRPLPPLTGHAHGPNFTINLRGVLEYGKMTRLLRQKLAGQTFAAGESWPARRIRVTVTDVSARRDGQRVAVSATVSGFFRGTLHLTGTPVFRDRGRLRGEVVIRNLHYTIETRNLFIRIGNRILQRRILNRMQENAQWDVSSELAQAYDQVNQALNQELMPGARLAGRLTEFRPVRLKVTNSGVELDHIVGGQVTVAVDPF
jgi:hypothetical protein